MAGKPSVTVPSIIAILIGFETPLEGSNFGEALKNFNTTGDHPPLGPLLSAMLPAVQTELDLLRQPSVSHHGGL